MALARVAVRWLVALVAVTVLGGCVHAPVGPEQSSRPVAGYLDYSYDKNSVLFNVSARHLQTVFMDTFYPFDPSLRYNNAEALVRYELDHKPFVRDGVLMVALADVRKLYAPYFSYTIDHAARRFTVEHHFFRKRVAAGSGSRAPTVEYTKIAWRGDYALDGRDATVSSTTHATTTSRDAIDKSAAASSTPPAVAKLAAAPIQHRGRIYVPVASFMQSLGKSITDDTSGSGFLAVSHVGAHETGDDLFNPKYKGGFPNTPITPGRVKTMNGLLSGAIDRGNLWFAYYFGDVRVFTGRTDEAGRDIHADMSVDRLLPYRLYVPKRYDPRVPSRFTFNLHGATGNENAPFERPNEHLRNLPPTLPGATSLEDFADHYNYIVLSPNGWTRGPIWGSGPGEQAMLHTLALVRQRYNIDPDRMFIFGNSAGGSGTMRFAMRHEGLFRAMAPTAPAGTKPFAKDLRGAILDMPTLISCFAADVTVVYVDTARNSCQPWYQEDVKPTLRNATVVTVENGHHSFGPASVYQMTFDFFERVLDKTPPRRVENVRIAAGRNTASVVLPGGSVSTVALSSAPVVREGKLLVALDDLARIYGPADFRIYDVHAYNRQLSDLVSVKTVLYERQSVNIKPGERFLRVGGAIHAGDTTGLKTRVAPDDPRIDRRMLSVPAEVVAGRVHVPVVEFMQLFGRTVIVE